MESWSALFNAMPDKEFQNVTRSTLPLLSYWMSRPLDETCDYHFEYTVASVGRARPSHTDLMIVGADKVVAVEGKSTEPRYETVAEWSSRPGSLRSYAIAHWVTLIEATTGVRPNEDGLKLCVYQMVHRLASACAVDRKHRTLTYQLFDVGGDHHFYRPDLEHIARTFRLDGIVEVRLERIETSVTPRGHELKSALVDMTPYERPAVIRQALLDGWLFEFSTANSEVIKTD